MLWWEDLLQKISKITWKIVFKKKPIKRNFVICLPFKSCYHLKDQKYPVKHWLIKTEDICFNKVSLMLLICLKKLWTVQQQWIKMKCRQCWWSLITEMDSDLWKRLINFLRNFRSKNRDIVISKPVNNEFGSKIICLTYFKFILFELEKQKLIFWINHKQRGNVNRHFIVMFGLSS